MFPDMGRLAAVLLPVLFPLALFAQKKFAVQDVRKDLAFLKAALYEAHPGVLLFNTKDSVDLAFTQLSDRLRGDSIPYEQAQVVVRMLVAMARDGHTYVETPFYDDRTAVLPIVPVVEGGHVYVAGNYSQDSTLAKGSEVLTINREPAATVVQLGKLLSTGDGHNKSYNDALAPIFFARHFGLFFGTKAQNRLLVRTLEGKQEEHLIGARSRAEVLQAIVAKADKQKTRQPILHYKTMLLWQDTLHADMAILQMVSFPNGNSDRFFRRAFRWMAGHNIRHLVIDLRNNTGGNIFTMDYLISRIADSPVSYQYEKRDGIRMRPYFNFRSRLTAFFAAMRYRMSFRLGHKHQDNVRIAIRTVKSHKEDNFNGKVWVLANGISFSSASMCTSFLQHKAGATVVGIETGGGAAGNCGGAYPKLILPHTRFKIRFPLYHLRYDIGKPDVGRGVIPDIPVSYGLKDLLSGKNKEMEAVYEHLDKH